MNTKVVKGVIAPIQMWLLGQGKCVGCGKKLETMKKEKYRKGFEKVTCSCRRIYIHDIAKNSYRRALLEEV